ncbi:MULTISPECIES: hypothetical protein [unclassified Brevundimonas]|jgi:hypothetical protein|uniref:hypothetical protein n=1 Tax=unclassified Brevundimonas TaxID=2622653 RepID=UPI000C4F1DED|nr:MULTISPECIES: hypothetical protein [unclassified Brevundimonas]MAL89762.1 hypothetical protein [Brevundimonas sp.]HAV49492.1 hypothetical protein [Brevundimonas sp.]|tara:strand:+ start:10641 stop:11258 length:618 start_codon:yes stop_codon:yes gene_type:complete
MNRNLKLMFGTVGIVALLAACSPEADAPTEPVPPPAATDPTAAATTGVTLTGEGWESLRIGMTRAEIVEALGEDANPNAVGGPDPESCDQFRPERAPESMLLMVQSDRLTRISLTDPSEIMTDKGLRVGDTAERVKAAYGDQAIVTPHKYQDAPAEYVTVWTRSGGEGYIEDENARGIVYEIGSDGTVMAIHAGGPSIQYIEGCA